MSWQDNIQKIRESVDGIPLAIPYNASFDSVPFHVVDTTTKFGRRTKLHEFPFKDIPFSEDFGKRASTFTVVGYIVQNKDNDFDYFFERDALIDALNNVDEPVTLVHPFLGIQKVALNGEVEMTESFTEGGIARFVIPFVNVTDKLLSPETTIDPLQEIDSVSKTGIEKLKEALVKLYTLVNQPKFIIQGVNDDLSSYTNMLRETVGNVKNTVSSTIGTALGIIADVESAFSSVINLPEDLADVITQGFNSFLGLVGLFEEDFDQIEDFDSDEISTPLSKSVTSLLTAMAEFGLQENNTEVGQIEEKTPSTHGGKTKTIPITTNDRARQAANRIAVVNYVRGNALLLACRIAVRGVYESFNEANDVMTEIVNAMDAFLEKLGADANNDIHLVYGINVEDIDTYDTISIMRPVFIKSMQILGADLAKIIDFEVGVGVLSSLELAYDRYEDINRSDNIFERNNELTNHPGFLPNLQTIEILSA